MPRVKSATVALGATLLAGVLSVTMLEPASNAAVRRATPPSSTFVVSSFNVLGSSHTPVGSKRAVGTTRIVWANQLLDQHKVDVVGFQELQADQYTKFMSITKGGWGVYPGLALRKRDSENSIGWRTSKFDLVQATTFNIPYFDGAPRAMPLVLLRNKASGMMFWFANVHNPSRAANAKWRRKAEAIEAKLQRQLWATGIPRFFTGDMNEREIVFCSMVRNAPVRAARGGYVTSSGVCNAMKPRAVDWIFGVKKALYTGYYEDRSALVAKTTDHPVISTGVTVKSTDFPKSLGADPVTPLVPVSY